jgi:hypothetical protein
MGGLGAIYLSLGEKGREKKEKENFIWGDLSELGRFDPVPSELGRFDPVPPLKKGEKKKYEQRGIVG